jgi:dUTP pyrophosphatase
MLISIGNPDNDGAFSYAFYNYFSEPLEIKKGEVIGQAVFCKYLTIDNDTASGKRLGGFGSTSK